MTAIIRDSTRSGVFEGDMEDVRVAAVELARVAASIKEAAERLTATLTDSGLSRSAVRAPRTGLPAQRALLRAGTNPAGLGSSLRGGALGGAAHKMSALTRHESLDALVAVSSLRLRVAAVARSHPEITEDPLVAEFVKAVDTDDSVAALRLLRGLIKEHGLGDTLHRLAPVFMELMAIHALLDSNPLNDDAGWAIACGLPVTRAPLLGAPVGGLCRWDVGDGYSHPVDLDADEAPAVSGEGTITGFLNNIALLKNNGRVYVQEMETDGQRRYVVLAPGMQVGMPRNDSPQDLVGAWRNTLMNESPYTRALVKAMESFGVPEGAEVALIGHSEGGAAVMNLAQDKEIRARYRITHAIAVGAPVDFKDPPAPLFVATITNQHDLIPTLDGQGAGSPFHQRLHPHWLVVDYNDDTHKFPDCHNAEKYLHNLTHDLHEARERINAELRPYQGRLVRGQAYRVYDDVHSPEGFPFLTVATAPAPSSAGAIELPVRCAESAAVTALFLADADAARDELAGTGLRPALIGRRAVAVVMARKFTRSSIGAHSEFSLGLVVHDPWKRRPISVWTELLAKADRRRSGIRVLDLAVGAPSGATYAAEIWGFPAFHAGVEVTLRRGRLTADLAADGEPVLSLGGRLGPWLPGPELDLVTYSTRGTRLLRSVVDTRGGQRIHPAPRLRLHADSSHPMAERLRRLGLLEARPFAAVSATRYQAKLDAGVVVEVPTLG
ncbi:hypothetical protein AB0N05_12065 [Nocardia sp. NPDC051030]|uniref:hypothetical protein n=1 Tax=Nocardia sp. NPDC051030 TaxID=3155162 RepID=UPI003431F9A3